MLPRLDGARLLLYEALLFHSRLRPRFPQCPYTACALVPEGDWLVLGERRRDKARLLSPIGTRRGPRVVPCRVEFAPIPAEQRCFAGRLGRSLGRVAPANGGALQHNQAPAFPTIRHPSWFFPPPSCSAWLVGECCANDMNLVFLGQTLSGFAANSPGPRAESKPPEA